MEGAQNDDHADEILAKSSIKIIIYQALNLDKSKLLIYFLSSHYLPQIMCVS